MDPETQRKIWECWIVLYHYELVKSTQLVYNNEEFI